MKKMTLLSITCIAAFICLMMIINDKPLWGQDGQTAPTSSVGKNIQVLTDIESVIELQTYMKTVADGLGVTCKFCHNLTDFSLDENEHKRLAREMMKMQKVIQKQIQTINETLYKDSDKKLRDEVTCYTCHRGKEHPANDKMEWEKILKEEG